MTFNHSTREAESGDFWVWDQPGLQSEFQDSQGYTDKPCLKKQNNKKTKKKKQKKKKNLQKSQALWLTPVTARQGRQEGKGAGHPQLHSKVEASLSYMRPYLRKQINK